MWLAVDLAALLALLTRALPWSIATDATREVLPVLAFLVIATVLAELLDGTGVFEVAGWRAARMAGGSRWRLFVLVCGLSAATTTLLSLDTTAVLLTPVVLTLVRNAQVPVLPYAVAAMWLANTASLLLPVSNLTNLLAQHSGQLDGATFARTMLAPWLAAIVVSVTVLAVAFRSQLRGEFALSAPERASSRLELGAGALSCVVLAVAVLAGLDAWAAALLAVAVVSLALLARRPLTWPRIVLPWRLTALVLGLFLLAATAQHHGLTSWAGDAFGSDDGIGSLLSTSFLGAGASNLFNNLPTYLGLKDAAAASGGLHGYALLIGVNVGPIVLIWASVANLLWRERCVRAGVEIPTKPLIVLGAIAAPLTVLAATLALWVS